MIDLSVTEMDKQRIKIGKNQQLEMENISIKRKKVILMSFKRPK